MNKGIIPMAILVIAPCHAGDVPPNILAKFIRIISSGKVACKDATMKEELGKLQVTIDDGSKFAYASTEGEVKALKAAGKCVICPKLEWLGSGATLAIVLEGSNPQMIIHAGNLQASGASLPEAVLKVSKRQ